MTTRETKEARELAAEHAPSVELNIGARLAVSARARPDAVAVRAAVGVKGGKTVFESATFAELHARANAIARGLSAQGLSRGDRTAVFVRPGVDLIAVVFALFELGAVPVLLDPGMGARKLVASLARIEPRAFVGVPLAHVLRLVHARALSSIRIAVTVGARWFPRSVPLETLVKDHAGSFEAVPVHADDEAAILFTSGSTGPAKGVVYTHAMFQAQVEALRGQYGFEPGEVDLACFPLFALFDVAFGMTRVFPLLDPSRPGRCDPARIAEALETFECNNTFGSPAIWRRVAPWCRAQGRWFPALKRVLIAGAPVSPELVEAVHGMLDGRGEVYTPYGATESLPVCSITGREILAVREKTEHGFGTCVGRPVAGIELAIIPVRDEPIERWDDALRSGPFQLGEVCVKGAVVTHRYASESEATRAAKIAGDEGFWHRMGDLGWLDDEGRLWFCGRKSHRLETGRGIVAPVPTENVVQRHPRVRRAALVGVGERGAQRAVLVIEPKKGEFPKKKSARAAFVDEVLAFLAAERRATPLHAPETIEHVLFHPAFPVDVRHNAKVKNELLQRWAEKKLA
ncbi:MAG: AMP-binding protein [Planctomycetes bacterium]|nr:AMP-binding protein [Planctomycetota bacterium]